MDVLIQFLELQLQLVFYNFLAFISSINENNLMALLAMQIES
jgi:hypothetical protein